eukprot:6181255-Pleurochrysis_carterae.AAC.2
MAASLFVKVALQQTKHRGSMVYRVTEAQVTKRCARRRIPEPTRVSEIAVSACECPSLPPPARCAACVATSVRVCCASCSSRQTAALGWDLG